MSKPDVADLDAYYGESRVLHRMSLTVESGQLVTLIGQKGAGKTTMLKSVVGLTPRIERTITYGSAALASIKPHVISQKGISLVPEHRRIFLGLSVRENLRMSRIEHETNSIFERSTEWIIDFFPRLEEWFAQSASTMSSGEQQMLAITRSLMSEPGLLLTDEPTEGLMPSLVEKLRNVLVDTNNRGISILLVEQDDGPALNITNYTYVISEGAIEAAGPAAEINENADIREEYLQV